MQFSVAICSAVFALLLENTYTDSIHTVFLRRTPTITLTEFTTVTVYIT